MYSAWVVTVSDRSFRGEREDLGGPTVRDCLLRYGYDVVKIVVVPDEIDQIKEVLLQGASEDVALIVTTGGTGFAPRDVTPEATNDVCERMVPGIPEAMRAASMKITPRGMLSRAVAGICKRSLIINTPGSPKAAVENLEAVLGAVDHGLLMLRGAPMDCATLEK